MKHPFNQTIENLKWLEEQDLPSEIWEMIIPKVDELNITIDMCKIETWHSGVKEMKLLKKVIEND